MLTMFNGHIGQIEAFTLMDGMEPPDDPDDLPDLFQPPNFADGENDVPESDTEMVEEIPGLNTDPEQFDESKLVTLLGEEFSKGKVSPSYFNREVYQDLASKGLADIPNVEHCGLSCHTQSKQWHARWGVTNFAPMWGDTLRSEQKALVMCIMKLWSWYMEIVDDEESKAYYAKLVEYSKSISF